jgi:hypothetical protein
MKKFINWMKESNRYKHLLGGLVIGFLPLHWWAGMYAALAAGLSMEFKDKAHGGKWDWIDCGMTVLGGVVGGLLTLLL